MASAASDYVVESGSQAQPPNRSGNLLGHAFVYGATSLFAYLVSMGKTIIVGRLFGTTPEMDAYAVAILLPNLIGALITSTSAGALVPALAKAEQENEGARATVFRSSLAIFSAASLVLSVTLGLLASPLAHLVGAAFDPYRLRLTVRMLRLASALVFTTGVYAVCSAELLARKRYWIVGLSPALGTLTSLVIILGLSKAGIGVLVWALVSGAALQAGILVLPAWSASRGGSVSQWGNKYVRHNLAAQLTLLGAAMLGVANGFIDQMFATWLPSGSVSALSYAGTLNMVAMQVVVMALAWVALPDFASLQAAGEREQLRNCVRQATALAVMLAAPASIGILAFGRGAIHLIFEHGNFHADSTRSVFLTWAAYSCGLVPAAIGMIVVRLMNAIGKNPILFRIGILLLLANAVLDFVLMRVWGLVGISLSTSLVYCISAIVLFVAVRPYFGAILDRRTMLRLCAAVSAALISIGPAALLRMLMGSTLAALISGVILFMVSLIATYWFMRLLHFEWYGFRDFRRIPFNLALGEN